MRLITKAECKHLTTYSFAHTARLEAEGRHPKRVRLSTGRVAYVEQEVLDWIAERVAARDTTDS